MPLERLDRLAIIIVGEQNTGKTTTLKRYCDYYYEHVSTFKQGWRYRVAPFRPKFETVKIWPYVLPSSRTERATPLE
jgi:GTPase SAR1 family protein